VSAVIFMIAMLILKHHDQCNMLSIGYQKLLFGPIFTYISSAHTNSSCSTALAIQESNSQASLLHDVTFP